MSKLDKWLELIKIVYPRLSVLKIQDNDLADLNKLISVLKIMVPDMIKTDTPHLHETDVVFTVFEAIVRLVDDNDITLISEQTMLMLRTLVDDEFFDVCCNRS